MSKHYDADPLTQQIAQEKLARKQFLRNEFLKQKTDPFKHASGQSGAVFDSAYLRFQSMQVNHYDFFKPSQRNVLYGIFFMVAPMVGYGYLMWTSRERNERAIRRGEISYRDRENKFK